MLETFRCLKLLRRAILPLVGHAGLVAVLAFSTPAMAQSLSVEAKYVINIGGTIIANAEFDLREDESSYTLDLDARVIGLGQFVARGSAAAKVEGRATSSAYRGESFNLQTRTSEGTVTVDVRFSGGDVVSFFTDPPVQPRIDQVPLERRQLVGVNDMLSAFIIKANGLDRSICDRKLRVFTGVERFDLQLHYVGAESATSARTGYQGPVILCQISYKPISGHYLSSEITNYLQTSDRILIWYAPVENSKTFIPYRVLIGTTLGDLSMVLTRLR